MGQLVSSAWQQLEVATSRAEEAQGTIRRLDAQRDALESALSQQDAACKAAKVDAVLRFPFHNVVWAVMPCSSAISSTSALAGTTHLLTELHWSSVLSQQGATCKAAKVADALWVSCSKTCIGAGRYPRQLSNSDHICPGRSNTISWHKCASSGPIPAGHCLESCQGLLNADLL